ncbi:MAG: hypothetical protein HC842_08150 [Cytophagales bacterium]|nr:hypothetical protein [Cytophagales bacterium]
MREREAIYLVYYQNLSYEEAATAMQVKVKTMYNFIYMGISNLRKHLSNSLVLFLCLRLFQILPSFT